MSEDCSIPVSIPLDNDGFLRRECPTCEKQFKCFSHADGDPDVEPEEQYFCPLCGVAAGPEQWRTPQQLDYVQSLAVPEIDRYVTDAVDDVFKGIKGLTYKPDRNFTLGIPTPEPLSEPDDMVIVEPPCHPTSRSRSQPTPPGASTA